MKTKSAGTSNCGGFRGVLAEGNLWSTWDREKPGTSFQNTSGRPDAIYVWVVLHEMALRPFTSQIAICLSCIPRLIAAFLRMYNIFTSI